MGTSLFEESEGKLLTVMVGEQEYGIPILEAREVVQMMDIEVIPHTPDFMRGVINLRGHIYPVIDLRLKFGQEAADATKESCIILVNLAGQTTGMIVDLLIGVTRLNPKDYEEHPELGNHIEAHFIAGMAKLEDRVILVLDLDDVLSNEELRQIQPVE